MFLSIPKEFFVPVVYSNKFILNTDNNNMEYDTDFFRESTNKKNEVPQKQNIVQQNKTNVEVNKNQIISNIKYECEKKVNDCIKADVDKENMFVEIDAEYIIDISKKKEDECE